MNNRLLAIAAAFLVAVSCARAVDDLDPVPVDVKRPIVARFIDEMVTEHAFDRRALQTLLGSAQIKPSIIKRISTPAERTLNWGEYRKIFITRKRIRAGIEFWREHRDMLERVSRESGVSVEMIVGIIGVETYFGRITGKDRVLDSLATLAFDYPPRQKFFRNELVQFLMLTREEGIDARTPTGSYAGAMGRPQFMPSSFRAYAIDASGDGKRDIWNNWADVAGSVANYFVEHGWRSGEDVTSRANLGSGWSGPRPEPKNTLKASATVESLRESGVDFTTRLCADSKAELLSFEGDDGSEYWVGFHNFFVITRYNRSVMYALAAHQLGQAIAAEVL
ncbi:MAG: lytic murein transglycosylase B [Gammaproteobacteria bacterium]|nr:lytic murein transglycosylase B [Gammaproteobacteria bacterium]